MATSASPDRGQVVVKKEPPVAGCLAVAFAKAATHVKDEHVGGGAPVESMAESSPRDGSVCSGGLSSRGGDADSDGVAPADLRPAPAEDKGDKLSKGELNQFRHHMLKAPDTVTNKWVELKERKPSDAERREFVREVIMLAKAKDSTFSNAYFTQFEEIRHEDVVEVSKEWIPWETYEKAHGFKMAVTLVKLKKVISREHIDLQGEDHGMEWPYYLEVKYIKRLELEKTTHSKGGRMESDKVELDATASAAASSAMAAAVMPTSSLSSPRAPKDTDANVGAAKGKDGQADPDDTVTLIKNLRQTHSDWDRRKSDYRGCLQKSLGHVTTKDSHIEKELRAIITEGDKLDSKLMEQNVVYIATNVLGQDGKDLVKASQAALFKLCKAGNSKMSALKTMMKS